MPESSFSIDAFYLSNVEVINLSKSMNIYLLKCSNEITAKTLLEKYKTHPQIKAIQYNHRFDYRGYTPVDSYYTNQWYLNNTGQYGYIAGVDIDAPQAWDSSITNLTRYGDTIVVAVTDTRFDLLHSDMNYFKNYDEIPSNGVDDDANGYIDDYNGWNANLHNDDVYGSVSTHANQVAGIISTKHNFFGVTGICNGVKIMPIYTQAVESQAVEAYSYIVDMRKLYDQTGGLKGAYIVSSNSSFGINLASAVDFPIWCAMYDSMGKYGVLSAASTINDNVDVDAVGDMPTTCLSEFLISVTGITGFNQKSNAGYGDTSIDIAAPSISILSCIGPDGYASGSGTSFSTPQISGAVAFLISYACEKFLDLYAAEPDSAIRLLKKYILDGAVTAPDLVGKSVTGGTLNLFNALTQFNTQFDCTNCNGTISSSIQNVLCNGDSTGSISISISPSNAHLSYIWSNGANTSNINQLQSGIYKLTITDSAGCQRIKTFNISEPNELVFDSISVVPVFNGSSGKIYVKGAGGVGPYKYSINGSNYYSNTLFFGLTPGTYTVYIKDFNGCIITQNVIVENHLSLEPLRNQIELDMIQNISDAKLLFN